MIARNKAGVSLSDFRPTMEILYEAQLVDGLPPSSLKFHNTYLLLEISVKKLALYYGLGISNTNHRINGYLVNLSDLEGYYPNTLKSIKDQAVQYGLFRELSKFDYSRSRYYKEANVHSSQLQEFLTRLLVISINWCRVLSI